jgi:glycyl-tRNA synthetase beta chain
MNSRDLLVEIGTEELPPKALPVLSAAFEHEVAAGLGRQNLDYSGTTAFATPRRLAVLVRDLQESQADAAIEKFGPALQAAYDADGKPTKAAEGFARSCGVSVVDLSEKNDGKVTKLYYQATRPGEQTADLLPGIINEALAALPIPKRMRWGSSHEEFVRPVHWVVLLFGNAVVPATILGVNSGSNTYGHRFHHPDAIALDSPSNYITALTETGFVLPDFAQRREKIRTQLREQGSQHNARVVIDENLLNEVTALVEWPEALTGAFDKAFLDVPKEALVSSMKNHQKCFTLEDSKGNILPNFITISNLVSQEPARVIAGNERVIRPRLADAAFFFEQDKKHTLESRQDKLQTVIFEQTLGTVFDKSQRVAKIAAFIAGKSGFDEGRAERAALLAKCDLLTGMVGEFAELQGIMGSYYACHDGEDPEVARAIFEQYLPRFAGDDLPETQTGIALALAERIDTIAGLFGIGQPPTGSKDPYALRRAALGILRIVVEKGLDLDLSDCITNAVSHYAQLPERDGLETRVLDFIFERFRAWYADEGVRANIFQAVDAVRSTRPRDFDLRIRAVREFTALKEAEALAAANKRVSNILAKLDNQPSTQTDAGLLTEAAEKQLAEKLDNLLKEVEPLLAKQEYSKALSAMASLQVDVDRFFDEVMVNTEDDKVRMNRQSLLQKLRHLFLQIADISFLQAA